MILVDSSVWIDYFRGTATPQTEKLDKLLGLEPLAIGDLIVLEVLQNKFAICYFLLGTLCQLWTCSLTKL